jgi:diadenylate cyclase
VPVNGYAGLRRRRYSVCTESLPTGVPVADASDGRDERRRAVVAAMAPGTALRDGLERILRASTGALIVLGYDDAVAGICSGGFRLDVAFSATRLRELAKMDGAIILDAAADTIVLAAVHLMPDPALPTDESGTRHRTAERVARQTGRPVVAVSKSMRTIGLYLDGTRHVLEDSVAVLSHANQALGTLERYRHRLDQLSGSLTALEIENLVTVRDVAAAAQRLEMVRRIAAEIEGYQTELGTSGRQLALQLDELAAGTADERELLVRDYAPAAGALAGLARLSPDELLDVATVAAALGFCPPGTLDDAVSPHGYRLLARIPRLPRAAAGRIAAHFCGLQKLLAAGVEELQQVSGISPAHARMAREGLSRLAESAIIDRYG